MTATVKENLVVKKTQNELWAKNIVLAHLVVETMVIAGGIIDFFMKKTFSPLLGVAVFEYPVILLAGINALNRKIQANRVS